MSNQLINAFKSQKTLKPNRDDVLDDDDDDGDDNAAKELLK